MVLFKFYLTIAITIINISEIFGHGMLIEPVNRGSAWKKGFKTPINYDDDGNYCGGHTAHFIVNKGKCGVCGDNYSVKQPRANENGGVYGTGTIVQTYIEGQQLQAIVQLTTNHWGTFDFALCPLENMNDMETEECFAKHPIKLADGERKYTIKSGRNGIFKINLILPKGVSCNHCSLRWNYRVANSWGICEDGHEAMGCGAQETFRTCSDIRILPNS
ncbi:hypothetical protein PV327_000004 [Microctonus hyperodae]|uniref:Chitin-binding type-4 domain-containing protein n=1 Tax=Microctonus hyperodae TaxID=165561 RepID=A0AA39G5B8_MICHY|nr:hypothetical protein PV327_000004 [Microctonus hyperodae]